MKLRDMDFTLCNSTKNRNDNLKKVIPLWKELPFSRCIIVDWNSDEPVWETLNHLMDERFTVVRVEYQPYYWSPIIHNFSIGLADTEWIMRTDSDIFFLPRTINGTNFKGNHFYIGGRPDNGRGTEGTVLLKREWWAQTGGYDERQTGYGYEDVHFYKRMDNLWGVEQNKFPRQSLIHIRHEDDVRLEHRDVSDIYRSSEIQGNFNYNDWNQSCDKYKLDVYTVHGKML